MYYNTRKLIQKVILGSYKLPSIKLLYQTELLFGKCFFLIFFERFSIII